MRKERPILYSTPMVIAKLEGRKTQTRRIIKESFNGCLTNGGPHPCPNDPVVIYPGETYESPCHPGESITVDYPEVRAMFHCSTLDSIAKCPYGKPGDILWVREEHYRFGYWRKNGLTKTGKQKWTFTPTSDEVLYHGQITEFKASRDKQNPDKEQWYKRLARFMPKSAARIFEEIISIRVERLQDISEEDAILEGIEYIGDDAPNGVDKGWKSYLNNSFLYYSPIASYQSLWDSINSPGSWELNPWVWVIETKVLSTTGRPAELNQPIAFTAI